MQTKNSEIFALIDKIAEHYRNNVANRFLRPAFYNLTLARRDWDNIESLTEKNNLYRQQGYELDELYTKILALAQFVQQARKIILPHVRSFVVSALRGRDLQEKVLAEMAGSNFGTNLHVLADQIKELYVIVTQVDASLNPGRPPVYQKMTELKSLGSLLVE